MKLKLLKLLATGLMASLLVGCETTGLSLREKGGTTYSNYVLSLPADTNASTSPRPSTPIRLAVAQVGETAPPERILQELRRHSGLFENVTGLPLPAEDGHTHFHKDNPPSFDYESRMRSAAQLARQAGADHVFLCGGNIDSWRANNFLSVFDITLIGGVVLPASKISMEGKAAGVLLEAKTLQPVFFVNAESQTSGHSPTALSDGKQSKMRAEMRDHLWDELTAQLIQKVSDAD